MRILYDSKQLKFKKPFGTLVPGQDCTLHVHVPASVRATSVTCELLYENHTAAQSVALSKVDTQGPYQIFGGTLTLTAPASVLFTISETIFATRFSISF